MSIKLDMLELDELFVEAGRTELLMPRQKAKGITTSWLDIKEEWSAYGYGHKRPLRIHPTARQITNYNKALTIGLKLPKDDRKVIWAVSLSSQHNYRGALMRAYYMQ